MNKVSVIFLFLFAMLTSGCATLGGGSSSKIKMPEVTEKKSNAQYIKQAVKTKMRVGSRLGQNFDFFYGPGGSYFVVVSAPQGTRIKLNNYDIMLKINSENRATPEQIQMALEDDQVASGFGDFREGPTTFELILTPINAEMNPAFKFEFKVNIVPTL